MTRQEHKDLLFPHLHKLFYIENDVLHWKKRDSSYFKSERDSKAWNSKFSDKPAGHEDNQGYLRVSILLNGVAKRYCVQNVIWAICEGKWPDNVIDHINHNRSDNRIKNLREVCQKQNSKNRKQYRNNKSGHTGVCFDKSKGKWIACIAVNGVNKKLGNFIDIEQAIEVRERASLTYQFHENHGKAL